MASPCGAAAQALHIDALAAIQNYVPIVTKFLDARPDRCFNMCVDRYKITAFRSLAMKKSLSILAAALALAAPLASFAQDAATEHTPAPYSVFVDQPTGYTFVKMPGGWKFVGAVSQEEAHHVPSTVLTSVLPADSAPRAVNTASAK
jgi:hypothetical protein